MSTAHVRRPLNAGDSVHSGETPANCAHGRVLRVEHRPNLGPNVSEEIYVAWQIKGLNHAGS